MADYRDWCGSCGNEIVFGSHDPDCDWLHAQRIARQEEREFAAAIDAEYDQKTEEELVDEAIALDAEIFALSNMLEAKQHKWKYLRDRMYFHGGMELFREKTGKKYV